MYGYNNATQGGYALRFTPNYTDNRYGIGQHEQHLTFSEYLKRNEAEETVLDPQFLQIPEYIQVMQNIFPIEEQSRQYAVDSLISQFEDRMLGMQDWKRWGKLFRNKVDSLTPSFWSQVNMISTMTSADLEDDENMYQRTSTGGMTRLGATKVISEGEAQSKTNSTTTNVQDTTTTQPEDSVIREAAATTVNAPDQIDNSLDYDWLKGADTIRQTNSNAGNQNVHTEGSATADSTTDSISKNTTTTSSEGSRDENTQTSTDTQTLTNKMFMYEREKAVSIAQMLRPLEWLYAQLGNFFYMIY